VPLGSTDAKFAPRASARLSLLLIIERRLDAVGSATDGFLGLTLTCRSHLQHPTAVPLWKSRSISERVWKKPGSICWRCFAPWIGWTCRPLKFPNARNASCLSWTPIMWKLSQHWTSLLPSCISTGPAIEITVRCKLDAQEAYSMVPGRSPVCSSFSSSKCGSIS
jgi:hypothetical protein